MGDPSSPAKAKELRFAGVADRLTIEVVISMADGRAYLAHDLIEQEDFRVVRLRNQIVEATSAHLEGSALEDCTFRCATCGNPVRLKSSMHGREVYYFGHALRGVNCPLTVENSLSTKEIGARRFQGQPEGERHKRIKRLLVASLEADPVFSSIAPETYWKPGDAETYGKRPDVQAIAQGLRHAFEAQLSSTSTLVISSRNRFYRGEGAVITWFTDFVPEDNWRMYLKDLADVHRGNVFVIDEATAVASMKQGRFMVWCHYSQPVWQDGVLKQGEFRKLIAFADLRVENGLTFYFDSVAAFEAATAGRAPPAPLAAHPLPQRLPRSSVWAAADELLDRLPQTHPRSLLLDFLAEQPKLAGYRGNRIQQRFENAKLAVAAAGAVLPDMRSREFGEMERRMAGLFSAELGKPMGYKFSNLVQVAHQIESGHCRGMTAFIHVARHFGTEKLLMDEDHQGHWKAKVAEMLRSAKYRESAPTVWAPYDAEPWWRDLVRAIYPDVVAFQAR